MFCLFFDYEEMEYLKAMMKNMNMYIKSSIPKFEKLDNLTKFVQWMFSYDLAKYKSYSYFIESCQLC